MQPECACWPLVPVVKLNAMPITASASLPLSPHRNRSTFAFLFSLIAAVAVGAALVRQQNSGVFPFSCCSDSEGLSTTIPL
jgi:hypothetical protein